MIEKVVEDMTTCCNTRSPFEIELKGFNKFPGVIYIDVSYSAELNKLQQTIQHLFISNGWSKPPSKDHGFHPHVTVAFRDLSTENFKKAWEVYKERTFQAFFRVEQASILKLTDGKWIENSVFPLEGS
jgi:2'-5' RNA ligase